jgi:hypothetical protein
MLSVALLMVTVITTSVIILAGFKSQENYRATFNRFCSAECINGKHNRNNYNVDKLY